MARFSGGVLFILSAMALLAVESGCNKGRETAPPAKNAGPGAASGGGDGESRPIRDIMTKIAKGPESLTAVIKRELDSDPVPWGKLQPQCKELAALIADMAKHEPRSGSKESWAENTAAFEKLAQALESAAQAKDKPAADAAYDSISGSCKSCHREHRMGGRRQVDGAPVGHGQPGKPKGQARRQRDQAGPAEKRPQVHCHD